MRGEGQRNGKGKKRMVSMTLRKKRRLTKIRGRVTKSKRE
jgi:hypothetical protein